MSLPPLNFGGGIDDGIEQAIVGSPVIHQSVAQESRFKGSGRCEKKSECQMGDVGKFERT